MTKRDVLGWAAAICGLVLVAMVPNMREADPGYKVAALLFLAMAAIFGAGYVAAGLRPGTEDEDDE